MKDTCLKSLANMPKLELTKLELSNNAIKELDLHILVENYADTLVNLKLNHNSVGCLDELKVLQGLKKLKKLNLSGNHICQLQNYSKQVYKILPQVRVLDSYDKQGNLDDTDDEIDSELDERSTDDIELDKVSIGDIPSVDSDEVEEPKNIPAPFDLVGDMKNILA